MSSTHRVLLACRSRNISGEQDMEAILGVQRTRVRVRRRGHIIWEEGSENVSVRGLSACSKTLRWCT